MSEQLKVLEKNLGINEALQLRPAKARISRIGIFILGTFWCLSWIYTLASERHLKNASQKKLSTHCSSVAPISREEYLTRQTDLAKILASPELGGQAYIAEPGSNTQFFANFSNSQWRLSERPLLLMISPVPHDSMQGDFLPQITILTPKFEAARAKALLIPSVDSLPIRYAEWAEDEDPYAKALAALPAYGQEGFLYVDHNIRKFIPDGLKYADPHTEIFSAPLAITRLRERKSEAELAILKCANEATLLAIRDVHKRLYPGIRESQARNMMAATLGAASLKDGGCLTLFGENAALPHGSGTDRTLGKSDFALFDCTGSLHGYYSDVTRTLSLGSVKITQRQLDIWNTVSAVQRFALQSAKNGTRTGSVDETARSWMQVFGYEQYFTHRLGHGIGLEVHEQPYLRGGNDAIIEIGHTFSNEPGIYIEGYAGVRLEDCFYVAEDGNAVYLTEGVGGAARTPWLP